MKKYGLVVAIKIEIDALKEKVNLEKIDDKFEIYKAIINDNELYVIHSGCGEIFGGIAAQYLITKYNCEIIFNFGICGALKPNLKTTSVCIINEIVDYEFDTDPIDHKGIGYHEELNQSIFKCNENLINKVLSSFDIPAYRCASGNKFIDTNQKRDYLSNTFNADICEMECFGIYLTCWANKIPCLFLKGISDSYDGGAQEYNKLAYKSSLIAADIFLKIITNI